MTHGTLPMWPRGEPDTLAIDDQCLRDVVALSMLPALWLGADRRRIAESLAASLYTMLNAQFVYVGIADGAGRSPVAVAQTDRYQTNPALAKKVGPVVFDWAREHDPDELLRLPHPLRAGTVWVATRAIGFHAELGIVAAAFADAAPPTVQQYLVLNIAASQAATAVQNANLLRSLQDSEERYRVLVEQVKDYAIFRTDPEGRPTTWNEGVRRVLGFEEHEFVGRDIAACIYTPDDVQAGVPQRELTEARTTGSASNDRWMRRKDGRAFYAAGTTSALKDETGALVGFTKVMRDQTEQKRLENLLRDSEEYFRELTQNMPLVVWTSLADGRIDFVNRRWQEMTGQTLEYVRAHPQAWISALHPDDQARAGEAYRDGVRSGDGFTLEARFQRIADDSYRWHLNRAVPIRDANGKVVKFLGTCTDIEEHKRTERTLRESESLFRGVVEATPECVKIVNADGTLQFMNAAGNCMVEGDAPLVGADVFELIAPECRAHWKTMHARVCAGERLSWSFDIVGLKGTRRTMESHAVPLRLADGQVAQLSVTRDITEKKQAEDTLRESERRLRFVLDAMPQKVFTAGPDGAVDYFSPQWMEFTGLAFEQIRDWGWKQFIHPDDIDENIRVWQHAIDTGTPFQFEHRFRRADGEYRWHISRALPLRDTAGRIVMWVGSNTDVHEIKAIQQVLTDADRRKDEFIATLSHELRSPLAPIRQAAKLLQMPGLSERDARWARDVIDRQVQAMAWLLDDLLDIARISRGKLVLRKESIDLAAAVDSAVETARPLIDAKRHALSIELSPPPVRLSADPLRLAQIMSNLLTNAAKYTDPQGQIRLWARVDGGELVIGVADTGIGISADMLPKLFEMFSQAQPALHRTEGGLGIGLALVRGLVELHGGQVHARSDGPGRGSEFIVRLPLGLPVAPAAEPVPAAAAVEPSAGHKVLVADDNRDTAESLGLILQTLGYSVRTAFDGHEALEIAQAFHPEVILLDIGMPRLNGYEAAQQLRQHPWGQRPVLIALTGWGQEEDKRRAMAAGFDYHLRKPVDLAVLQSLLAEIFSSVGAERR